MRTIFAAFAAIALTLSAGAYEPVPEWAFSLPPAPGAATTGAANAVVRRADTLIQVEADGQFVTERRVAIEILRNAGAKSALERQLYNAASDKVQEANAWIIRQGKEVEAVGKSAWLDLAANADGALIDETRQIVVTLENRAVQGDLVIFQTKIRSKEFLGDRFFDYTPGPLPKAGGTLEFSLPPGWTESSHPFGPLPPPSQTVDGNIHRWTLPATPYVPDEPLPVQTPSGLIVTLGGPGSPLKVLHDWTEVGQYVNRLQTPQCDTSAELKAKVQALTVPATDDPGRIRALGRFVQDLRYVAINRNLALGHGYRPRLASEVLKTGYGDCKDKATLLRAMLREIGVSSHLVLVWVAPGALIDEAVATPVWFNHAILAIELPAVPEEWRSAVVTHEGKNLLIFDPTNRLTVMGDLAGLVQGARAFLSQDAGGAMVSLPSREAAVGFSLRREIKVQLSVDGTSRCQGVITSNGQVAAALRSWIESSGTDLDLEKMINYQLSDRFRTAVIGTKSYRDDLVTGISHLEFDCNVRGFCQPLPGDKAVMKFDLFSQKNIPAFPEKERFEPIQLNALMIDDAVTVALAPGWAVADLPKPAELQSAYGRYSLQIHRQESELVVNRHYELTRQVVPVEDYQKLKQFLATVAKADRSAAILRSVPAAPQ